MREKFQLNKTYLVKLQKKDSEYSYEYKILVNSIFDNKINVLSTEYKWWWILTEIKFDDYKIIEITKINEQDFSDEYIEVIIDKIKEEEKSLKDLKDELKKRENFIQNRSFLWKVINYFK